MSVAEEASAGAVAETPAAAEVDTLAEAVAIMDAGRDGKGRFLPRDAAEKTADAEEKPAEKVEEKKQERQAAAFAALAKKERQTTADAAALKAEREAFAKEREAVQREKTEASEFAALLADAKKDPIKLLRRANLTFDEVATAILNADKPETPETKRDRELAEARAEIEAIKKSKLDDEERRRAEGAQQFVQKIRQDIDSVLRSDADRFELLLADPGGREQVLRAMDYFYAEGSAEYGFAKGTIPSVEKVADLVENRLVEHFANTAARSKKLQARVTPVTTEPKAPEAKTDDAGARAIKAAPTLSNRTATSPASATNGKHLSTKESLKLAASMLRQKA